MTDKVLVAVDLNDLDDAKRVAQRAARLAQMDEAELHVLNVLPDTGMSIVGSYLDADHAKAAMAKTRELLSEFVQANLPGLPADRLHIGRGPIYDQIIKTANAIGADVTVVGAHSPELRDYLIGPNSARVARHSDNSVFIVR